MNHFRFKWSGPSKQFKLCLVRLDAQKYIINLIKKLQLNNYLKNIQGNSRKT